MNRRTQVAVLLGAVASAALAMGFVPRRTLVALFVTAEQQGDWLLRRGRFEEAAARFTDPMRQGVAWYRAANFEAAARSFARVPGAEGSFNQGNALLMHGAYDKAVAAYDRALASRPGWAPAGENRAIALARAERVKTEGGDMTGGQVEADEVVFDLNGRQGAQEQQADGGAPMSDAELDGLWLRRVQTTPGDFLRAKFACQAARRSEGP